MRASFVRARREATFTAASGLLLSCSVLLTRLRPRIFVCSSCTWPGLEGGSGDGRAAGPLYLSGICVAERRNLGRLRIKHGKFVAERIHRRHGMRHAGAGRFESKPTCRDGNDARVDLADDAFFAIALEFLSFPTKGAGDAQFHLSTRRIQLFIGGGGKQIGDLIRVVRVARPRCFRFDPYPPPTAKRGRSSTHERPDFPSSKIVQLLRCRGFARKRGWSSMGIECDDDVIRSPALCVG